MCGIAGLYYHEHARETLPETLREMARRLQHRGPDDEGFMLLPEAGQPVIAGSQATQSTAWNAPMPYAPNVDLQDVHAPFRLGLAHRRLAVLDLTEAAHQPMCNEDGSVWIVCNGELYNHAELRQELTALGHHFKTRSDMEVLLRAWEQWDVRCLDHFNGMWAFVVYDRRQQLLFGARDRFGVKPMYYYHYHKVFGFASEQKALLAIPEIKTGVNPAAVYEHLLLGQVELRPEGFFQNIMELSPAHYFLYNLETGRLNVHKYYHLSFRAQDDGLHSESYENAVAEVRTRMNSAVKQRLIADVPVGFCLSGGIDSSSIVCLAEGIRNEQPQEQLTQGLHTFTAINNGGACDESEWAARVAGTTKAHWHTAPCRAEDIVPELEELVYHQDVPLYSTSTFAQSRVMKAAKEQGITILLDGQGGDELFAGYQTFYTSLLWNDFKNGRWKSAGREWSALNNSPTTHGIVLKTLLKLAADHVLPPAGKDKLAAYYRPELRYFTREARARHAGLLSLTGEFSTQPVNELLHTYFTGYYLKNLLRWEDRCSMQYSIESRTPFADDIDLIETVFSYPAHFKIRNGWSKALLRDAMKGILPDDIRLRRDKLGFATPQDEWLRQINADMKSQITQLCPLDTSGIIDPQRLLRDWDTIFAQPSLTKARDFAFRYLNYLIWTKKFF